MADISTITSALMSIKTATDLARIIKESVTFLDRAEVNLKLAELVSALADAKVEIAQVQEMLLAKDGQIRELSIALDIKGRMMWDAPYYWLDDNGRRDGPYCQQCYDNNRKLIRLQTREQGAWSCLTCGKHYIDKTYREPSNDYDKF